jgi:hypothetical protein
MAAKDDTVYVAFQSTDNDSTPTLDGGAYQGWGKRGYRLEGGLFAGQTHMVWQGAVFLDRDFVVAEGETLTVMPGTQIFATSQAAGTNLGSEAGLVEIVVLGTLRGDATGGAAITMQAQDGTGPWGGILFNLSAAYDYSSGSYATTQGKSALANVTIDDAKNAIRIRNRIAPELQSVVFKDCGADILLDLTDIVIPRLHAVGVNFVAELSTWDLLAPVRVVATQSMSPVGDALFGTSGKLDLIVQSLLVTRENPSAPGALVTFEPDVVTPPGSPSAGNDWGGIFVDKLAGGTRLEWADIGHASNPVFVQATQDVEIRNTTIHDFASTGLWLYGSPSVVRLPNDPTLVVHREPTTLRLRQHLDLRQPLHRKLLPRPRH